MGYISKFDVHTLEEKRYFEGDSYVFTHIKYVKKKELYYILGFERVDRYGENIHFIMIYSDNEDRFERVDLNFELYHLIYNAHTDMFLGSSLLNDEAIVIPSSCISLGSSNGENRRLLDQTQLRRLYFPHTKTQYSSSEGNIVHISFSSEGRYLAAVRQNMTYIYEYPLMKLIDSIEHKYSCYAEFSYDDKYLLVGTWTNGYIYALDL